jgi:hypothetical protein
MTLKIIAGKYDSVTRDNKRKTRGITELNLKFDGTGRET